MRDYYDTMRGLVIVLIIGALLLWGAAHGFYLSSGSFL